MRPLCGEVIGEYTPNTLVVWGKHRLKRLGNVTHWPYLENFAQSEKDEKLKSYIAKYKNAKTKTRPPIIICTKKQFISKKLANEEAARLRSKDDDRHKPIRSYECPKCNAWHLTSISYSDYKERIQ